MICFYLDFVQGCGRVAQSIQSRQPHVAHKIEKRTRRPYYADEYSMAVVRTLQAGLAVSLHLRLVRPCPCFPMFPKLASPLCAVALGRFWKLCPALVTSLSLPVAPNVITKSPGRFAGDPPPVWVRADSSVMDPRLSSRHPTSSSLRVGVGYMYIDSIGPVAQSMPGR